ncbi:MAG: PAS domain S-box protein [Desulfatibacillaceae bacterium]
MKESDPDRNQPPQESRDAADDAGGKCPNGNHAMPQEAMQLLLDLCRDAMLVSDLAGNILDCNRKALEMAGYDSVEAMREVGATSFYSSPGDRETGLDTLLREGELNDKRVYLRNRDGELRVCITSARLYRPEGRDEPVILSTLRDMTDWDETKKALETSEKRFQAQYRALPLPTFTWEARQRGGFRLVSVNDTANRLSAGGAEKLVGRTSSDIFRDRPDVEELLASAHEQGGVENLETRYRPPGFDRELFVRFTAVHVPESLVMLHAEDITGLRRAQQDLEASLRFNQGLLENSPNPILVADSDTVIVYVNHALEKLTGYASEEILGTRAPYPWWDPRQRDKTRAEFNRAFTQGIRRVEVPFVKKSGEPFWVEITAMPVEIDTDVTYYMANWTETTLRRSHEEALRQSARRFRNTVVQSGAGYFLMDTAGRYKEVNEAWLDMYGHASVEEVRGRHFTEMVPVEDVPANEYAMSGLLAGEPVRGAQGTRLRGDGTVGHHSYTAAAVEENGRVVGVEGFVIDTTERKRMEARLLESRRRYRELFNRIPVGLFRTTPEGEIEDVNPAMVTILGYPDKESLLAVKAQDLYENKEDRDFVVSRVRARGYISDYEVRMLRRDGDTVWTMLHISGVRDENGEVVAFEGSLLDVTARKRSERELARNQEHLESLVRDRTADLTEANRQLASEIEDRRLAQEALAESEQKYRNLVELAQDGIVIVSRGSVAYANPGLCSMLGKGADRIVGRDFHSLLHPGDQGADGRQTRLHDAGFGTLPIWDCRMMAQDGSVVDVECSVGAITYDGCVADLIVVRDVTERKKVQAALRESEEKFRLISEQSLMAIAIFQGNRVRYANEAFAHMAGWPVEEVISWGPGAWTCLIHPEDQEIVDKARREQLAEQGAAGYSHRVLSRDGRELHVEVHLKEITYEGKTAELATLIDITDRKRAEAEKSRLEAQLSLARRMEAIGTLAGGIAHDFNNILTPVIVRTEIAMLDAGNEETVREHLAEVLKAAKRARDLVGQIIAFGRQSEQGRSAVGLDSVVEEALGLIRSSLPPSIEIQSNLDAADGVILANPTQIHQVVMNLCANAGDSMAVSGGVLSVSTKEVFLKRPIARDVPAGKWVRLTVEDTGHGMSPAVMERIFDPFFTTKGWSKGTGMGLSMVQGIVLGSGGAITVSSEPGAGARFDVYLPPRKGPVPAVRKSPGKMPEGTERILLVDDEQGMVDVVDTMLTRLGYTVTGMTRPREALRVFQLDPQGFDLVITDQTMPGMTGLEMAGEMLLSRPDLPVILCTGYTENVTEKAVKDAGIAEFVKKPIVMGEISHTLRKLLDRYAQYKAGGPDGQDSDR